eukprot:3518626-Rhodomonas_salina.2
MYLNIILEHQQPIRRRGRRGGGGGGGGGGGRVGAGCKHGPALSKTSVQKYPILYCGGCFRTAAATVLFGLPTVLLSGMVLAAQYPFLSYAQPCVLLRCEGRAVCEGGLGQSTVWYKVGSLGHYAVQYRVVRLGPKAKVA